MDNHLETIVLGGGCFWCTEAVFKQLKGAVSVASGYAGGSAENPAYEQVATGITGHAETVKVEFDPAVVSLRSLLEVFFSVHDPTSLNRQGSDVGTQYRSAIFYTSPRQRKEVRRFIGDLEQSGVFAGPIVTEVAPLRRFYEAEADHRDYYKNNAAQPYCQLVINPKLSKFRDKFRSLLKE